MPEIRASFASFVDSVGNESELFSADQLEAGIPAGRLIIYKVRFYDHDRRLLAEADVGDVFNLPSAPQPNDTLIFPKWGMVLGT